MFLVLTVIREILTLLTILHLETAKTFLLPAALSYLTRFLNGFMRLRTSAKISGFLRRMSDVHYVIGGQ